MAYKAPLPMRVFHSVLWAVMASIIAWFVLIPIVLRVTAAKPTGEIAAPIVPQVDASASIDRTAPVAAP